jgi:LPS sulfotransferase NodH
MQTDVMAVLTDTHRRPGSLAERVAGLAPVRYVILFGVRSGSTLLCSDLAQVGLGRPTEHFQGRFLPADGTAGYVEDLVRAESPVFGTKLAWEQAFALLRRLADEDEVACFDLREVFGDDVRIVRLVRRNKARQAISAWRAAVSRVWHLPADTAGQGPRLPYDRDAIVQVMLQLLAEEWLWERHLADLGLEALTIAYEDYVDDRRGWLSVVARHLGLSIEAGSGLEDLLRPVGDEWTDMIEGRLLEDLSAPDHPFWASLALRQFVPSSLPPERCVPLLRSREMPIR